MLPQQQQQKNNNKYKNYKIEADIISDTENTENSEKSNCIRLFKSSISLPIVCLVDLSIINGLLNSDYMKLLFPFSL